jgi:hypothetical protein
VWRYRDSDSWQELSTQKASWLGVDAAGDVIVDLTGHGIFQYAAGSLNGVNLTGADASMISLDPVTGNFVAEFAGHGVWVFKPGLLHGNNPWQQLKLHGKVVAATLVGIEAIAWLRTFGAKGSGVIPMARMIGRC